MVTGFLLYVDRAGAAGNQRTGENRLRELLLNIPAEVKLFLNLTAGSLQNSILQRHPVGNSHSGSSRPRAGNHTPLLPVPGCFPPHAGSRDPATTFQVISSLHSDSSLLFPTKTWTDSYKVQVKLTTALHTYFSSP